MTTSDWIFLALAAMTVVSTAFVMLAQKTENGKAQAALRGAVGLAALLVVFLLLNTIWHRTETPPRDGILYSFAFPSAYESTTWNGASTVICDSTNNDPNCDGGRTRVLCWSDEKFYECNADGTTLTPKKGKK